MSLLQTCCVGACWLSLALAAPSSIHSSQTSHSPHVERAAASYPETLGTPVIIGQALDISITRDSCGSSKIAGRLLWTCRDTSPIKADGLPQFSLTSSSASWSDLFLVGPFLGVAAPTKVGGGKTLVLANKQYGTDIATPYFPIPKKLCGGNTAGACLDRTRYALWPDSPPLVTQSSLDGSTTAYTWIRQLHINQNLQELNPNPATTLYRLNYNPNLLTTPRTTLPTVTTVAETFYTAGSISYGSVGNVVHDGVAYLYGTTNAGIALARVSTSEIENLSAYEYFYAGAWRKQRPGLNNAFANVPNASAGGQGTYYYYAPWKAFVWIGQAGISVSADFYITTAPKPEGPWTEPRLFYSAPNGNYSLGSYSLQAHPDMSLEGSPEVYLSYTKNDVVEGYNLYSTQLIHVVWQLWAGYN